MVTSEATMGQMEGSEFRFPNEIGENSVREVKERADKFLSEMWANEAGNSLEAGQIDKIMPVLKEKVQALMMHTYFALDNSKVMSFIDKNPIDGVEDVAAIAALVAWPFVRDLAVKYMTERAA